MEPGNNPLGGIRYVPVSNLIMNLDRDFGKHQNCLPAFNLLVLGRKKKKASRVSSVSLVAIFK